MAVEIQHNKSLIKRFVKDYNLPINVFEPGLFEYYRKLYDFFPNETWNNLIETIQNKYNGNVEDWLNYCSSVRDNAINYILNNEEYKKFISMSMESYSRHNSIGEHSCYTNETDGNTFISIDLKKANFQALKFKGILTQNTYENFINDVGGDTYIAGSKYLRQVIFGKCNPSRQITIEKYLISSVLDYVVFILHPDWIAGHFELFSLNSDEIVLRNTVDKYEPKGIEGRCKRIETAVKNVLGLDVKVDLFRVEKLPITNGNGDSIDAYVKCSYVDGTKKLKKASTTFFPQIYKLWKGQQINEIDKMFWFENQIATFNNALRLNY